MAVNGISPISVQGAQSLLSTQKTASSPVEQIGNSFADMLNSLTETENASNELVTSLAAGENVDLHDVMIGLEQTDIQFRVAMSIRDKLVSAYNEIMRMQV